MGQPLSLPLCPGRPALKLLNFIINTNIFISLAAVVFTLQTQILLGLEPQLHPYLFIIFFATIFEYNLHRLITILHNPDALDDHKHSWVKKNTTAFYILVAASVAGFLCAVLLAKPLVLLVLFPIGLITLFYSLPVFKNKKTIFRLREIPGLKIILISIVWSASTILLPIVQSGIHFPAPHVAAMLLERFIFVFAITLPFDIRDMKPDQSSGLKTIPLWIGEQNSLRFAALLLFLFACLSCIHYTLTGQSFVIPALVLSALSTLFFITNKKIRAVSHYHYFVLDGTMLLQGALVYLSYYLHA
jgi:4-hydroxybenzoate polyprenyltransferase